MMKKYVRTFMYNEDSIFEVIEEYEKTIKCKLTNCENGYIVIGKNNVLKQANTIEELCDEYVVFYGNTYHVTRKYEERDLTPQKIKYNLFTWGVKEYEIYGAIWTDKGLIYVAKMNSEGKLCLI